MKVFISYAKPDADRARALYSTLIGKGYDVWFDKESLLPGQIWEEQIRLALQEADAVLLVLSNNSVDRRGYFQKELTLAINIAQTIPRHHIYLLPLRYDDCPVPLTLAAIQRVDMFPSFDNGLGRVFSALDLKSAGPQNAVGWQKLTGHAPEITPSDLDVRVAQEVDLSRFKQRKSWGFHYWMILKEETNLGENKYIFWNGKKSVLEKFYKEPGGVRWHGPEGLDDDDRKEVEKILKIKRPN